jgi:hypothetical protein
MVLSWDFGERRGWRSNRSPKLIPQRNPHGHSQRTGYRVSDRVRGVLAARHLDRPIQLDRLQR